MSSFFGTLGANAVQAFNCDGLGPQPILPWRLLVYLYIIDVSISVESVLTCPVFLVQQVRTLFKRSIVTDWGRNPFCRGSYSYVGVGASGADYDELARPVGR